MARRKNFKTADKHRTRRFIKGLALRTLVKVRRRQVIMAENLAMLAKSMQNSVPSPEEQLRRMAKHDWTLSHSIVEKKNPDVLDGWVRFR